MTEFKNDGCNGFFDDVFMPCVIAGHTIAIRYVMKTTAPAVGNSLLLKAKLDGSNFFERIRWNVIITDANVKQICVIPCGLQDLFELAGTSYFLLS